MHGFRDYSFTFLIVMLSVYSSNHILQLKTWWQVVGVTGLVLTKLDGSARGGCVVY